MRVRASRRVRTCRRVRRDSGLNSAIGRGQLRQRHSVAPPYLRAVILCWLASRVPEIGGDNQMKALVSILALSLVVAFSAPAFAGAPKTEAACKKAGMQWDATAKKCTKGM
jgi:hypothetical protein